MNIAEHLISRLPRHYPYASTVFSETIYVPQGVEIQTQSVLHTSSLSKAQQREIKRLEAAGVKFYDKEKGYHLSMVNPGLAYSLDGNKAIITADAGEGDYVVSRALIRPGRREKKVPIEAKTVGAGIVVRTKDGKFIGVTRSLKNGNYSGFREVSASGGITIKHVEPNQSITDIVEETMREEVSQEMKVSEREAATMPMMPLVLIRDERLPHFGIGFVGQSSLTSDEIMQGQYAVAEQDNTPHDFSESLHVVGGTPEEVRAYILDTTRPPLTPLARELWLAAAARLIFETEYFEAGVTEQKAREKAETWRLQCRQEVDTLYHELDRQAKRHYRRHPSTIKETQRADKPRRYWAGGLDPAAALETQGFIFEQQEETVQPTAGEAVA